MIPTAYKKQLSCVLSDGFVIKRSVFQKCIEMYPMQQWNAVMGKINKLNRFVKKNNDFIRRFTAGVKLVEVDASGRILIPTDLCQYSSLTKDIILSSSVSIIEIWDKNNYEKVIDNSVVNFAELAEEVMGNIGLDGLS